MRKTVTKRTPVPVAIHERYCKFKESKITIVGEISEEKMETLLHFSFSRHFETNDFI